MIAWISDCISKWLDKFGPARKLVILEGDSLPKRLPRRNVVLAKDDEEDWCVGMRCPCGCGRIIELLLIPEASPRWRVTSDTAGRPTLHPSVHMKDGCKSHFWLRQGRVQWCE